MNIEPRKNWLKRILEFLLYLLAFPFLLLLGGSIGGAFYHVATNQALDFRLGRLTPFVAMIVDVILWVGGIAISHALLFNASSNWRLYAPVTPKLVIRHGLTFRAEWPLRVLFAIAVITCCLATGVSHVYSAQGTILEAALITMSMLLLIVMMLTANFGEIWHGRYRIPFYLARHLFQAAFRIPLAILGAPGCLAFFVILFGLANAVGRKTLAAWLAVPFGWIIHAPDFIDFFVYLISPVWGLGLAVARGGNPMVLGAMILYSVVVISRSLAALWNMYSREHFAQEALPDATWNPPPAIQSGSDKLNEAEHPKLLSGAPPWNDSEQEDEPDRSSSDLQRENWQRQRLELANPKSSSRWEIRRWRQARLFLFHQIAKSLSVESLWRLDRSAGRPRIISWGTRHQPLLYDPTADPLDQWLRFKNHNAIEPRRRLGLWGALENRPEVIGCFSILICVYLVSLFFVPILAVIGGPIVARGIAFLAWSRWQLEFHPCEHLGLPVRFRDFANRPTPKGHLSPIFFNLSAASFLFLFGGFNPMVFVCSLASFTMVKPIAWKSQLLHNFGRSGHRWIRRLDLGIGYSMLIGLVIAWLSFFILMMVFNKQHPRAGYLELRQFQSTWLLWVFLFELCLHFVLACATAVCLRLRTRVMDDSVMMETSK